MSSCCNRNQGVHFSILRIPVLGAAGQLPGVLLCAAMYGMHIVVQRSYISVAVFIDKYYRYMTCVVHVARLIVY